MKLNETTFKVFVNKRFVEVTESDIRQIAWFVKEAATKLDVAMWSQNQIFYETQQEQMDCWLHAIMVKNKKLILEAIPFPVGCLLLGVQEHPDTLLEQISQTTMILEYPKDFEVYLSKTPEELSVGQFPLEVHDGQNRNRKK